MIAFVRCVRVGRVRQIIGVIFIANPVCMFRSRRVEIQGEHDLAFLRVPLSECLLDFLTGFVGHYGEQGERQLHSVLSQLGCTFLSNWTEPGIWRRFRYNIALAKLFEMSHGGTMLDNVMMATLCLRYKERERAWRVMDRME